MSAFKLMAQGQGSQKYFLFGSLSSVPAVVAHQPGYPTLTILSVGLLVMLAYLSSITFIPKMRRSICCFDVFFVATITVVAHLISLAALEISHVI